MVSPVDLPPPQDSLPLHEWPLADHIAMINSAFDSGQVQIDSFSEITTRRAELIGLHREYTQLEADVLAAMERQLGAARQLDSRAIDKVTASKPSYVEFTNMNYTGKEIGYPLLLTEIGRRVLEQAELELDSGDNQEEGTVALACLTNGRLLRSPEMQYVRELLNKRATLTRALHDIRTERDAAYPNDGPSLPLIINFADIAPESHQICKTHDGNLEIYSLNVGIQDPLVLTSKR